MTTVVLETNYGEIVIELDEKRAPISCDNFLKYVAEAFFDHTIFHRVVKDFVIQSGGFNNFLIQKPITHPDIPNEAANTAKNTRGTVGMARDDNPDSANCEFYINVQDNPHLDHGANGSDQYGYCVFARVIQGIDVVDKINICKTINRGEFEDVPVKPVKILKAKMQDNMKPEAQENLNSPGCFACFSQCATSMLKQLAKRSGAYFNNSQADVKISPFSAKTDYPKPKFNL